MVLSTPQLDLEGQPLALPSHQSTNRPYEHDYNDDTSRGFTRKQLFYILGPQGVGAAIIDAVANFAIACAMYRTTRKEIRLWPLEKNTIAGDMGVTVIIQSILTTLITSALVRGDVRAARIEPFEFAWPYGGRWQRKVETKSWWKCRARRALCFLSPTQTLSFRAGLHEFCKSLFDLLLRGFLISTIYFLILWPLAIAITAPLYGGIDMHGTWTPEIIKAVFGGVLGLFMNPFVAALVLAASHSPSRPSIAGTRQCRRIMSTTPIAPAPMPSLSALAQPGAREPEMQQVPVIVTVAGPMRPALAHVSTRS